jgi:hypothetical protein
MGDEPPVIGLVVETPDGTVHVRAPEEYRAESVACEVSLRNGYRYTPDVHQLVRDSGDPLRPGGSVGGQGVSDGDVLHLDANPEEAAGD